MLQLKKELEREGSFFNENEAEEKLKEYFELKKEIEEFQEIEKKLKSVSCVEEINFLKRKITQKKNEKFFASKYDKNDAILQISAGAGGLDAQDWTVLLKEMYEKFAQKHGFKVETIDINYGKGVGPKGRIGIKSITLEIKGKYAFGLLKNERGVHRLVRISPFSPQKLRHTSFAKVEVFPRIEEKEIKINPSDLKIDFLKASGHGGQYVNKRMSAVRITHLPTGLVVSCQSERSQLQNKERALEVLYSKLMALKEKEKESEIEKIKVKKEASFSNQIRSYILDPYKLVKDHRTKVEERDVEKVFEGHLEKFIETQIFLQK